MGIKKIIIVFILVLSGFFITSTQANDDISSPGFTINVSDISPGGSGIIESDAETTVDNFLQRIIERLIIGIGTVALFVMTIGAGQIILYAGEDERLTRGKTIFTGGLIAVGVALLSGLMVQLVAYLLYI